MRKWYRNRKGVSDNFRFEGRPAVSFFTLSDFYFMNCPEPSREARSSSVALKNRIVARIESRSGWISFADYMQQVLYEPEYGYYSGGAANFGGQGDFVTAPETSPLYGRAMAHALIPLIEQTRPQILEIGAGTGRLAHDILAELASKGISVDCYDILELSSELRERQQTSLSACPHVNWLSALPERFDGVVIANEVLDAMPVQLVVKRKTGWQELGVCHLNGDFVLSERPCDTFLADAITRQIPDSDSLPEGYVTEIHTHACGFVRTLAEMLASGSGAAAVFVDYGFPAHEYYHRDRSSGTLMCHYRHRLHTDPFFLPGLQDMTAHVDFTALARIAEAGGLDLLCYASQANFLIGAGLMELMQGVSAEMDARQYSLQSQAVQKLLSPAEMGELFKVMILGHNVIPPAFMLDVDKSGRL